MLLFTMFMCSLTYFYIIRTREQEFVMNQKKQIIRNLRGPSQRKNRQTESGDTVVSFGRVVPFYIFLREIKQRDTQLN